MKLCVGRARERERERESDTHSTQHRLSLCVFCPSQCSIAFSTFARPSLAPKFGPKRRPLEPASVPIGSPCFALVSIGPEFDKFARLVSLAVGPGRAKRINLCPPVCCLCVWAVCLRLVPVCASDQAQKEAPPKSRGRRSTLGLARTAESALQAAQ